MTGLPTDPQLSEGLVVLGRNLRHDAKRHGDQQNERHPYPKAQQEPQAAHRYKRLDRNAHDARRPRCAFEDR